PAPLGRALEKTGKLTMHRLIFRLIVCWKQRFLYVRCSYTGVSMSVIRSFGQKILPGGFSNIFATLLSWGERWVFGQFAIYACRPGAVCWGRATRAGPEPRPR